MESDDSDDDLMALIASTTSRKKPTTSAKPATGVGQAAVERAILGKRGSDEVDLAALLKAAKKRDTQREENEQELSRLTKENAASRLTEPDAAEQQEVAEGAESAAAAPAEAPPGGSEGAPKFVTRTIFARAPRPLSLRPLQCGDSTDTMLAMLGGADEPTALQLVEGGWLEAHFAHGRSCPAEVQRWLFLLVSYHPRPAVAASAARALGALLDGTTQPSWVPTPAHFLRVLSNFGADMAVLGEPALGDDQGVLPDEMAASGASEDVDEAGGRPLSDVRHNLLHLLELPASCARHWRALPAPAQLGAARWVWRLMLEPLAAPAFLLLQDALGRLLDGPVEAVWQGEWLPWAGAALRQLDASLADEALVQLCQWLPPTLRGQRLQRRAAHAAIVQLMARRGSGEKHDEGAPDEDADGEEGSPESLGRLLARIQVRAWVNHMASLHSVLLLLDLALSSEAAAHRARPASLAGLVRQMKALRPKVSAAAGGSDYHALEVENILTFLPSKLTHLFGLN